MCLESTIASRMSCATQRPVRSPQVLFLNACALPTARRAPRFCAEVFAPELELLLIPIRNSRAGLLAFKSGSSVLEKLSLPLIKHRRVDAVLLAQIRNGFAFDQMLAQDGDLLLRAKKTSVIIVHRGLFFQASSSLASAHDFPIP